MIPIFARSVENLTDARYFAAWQVDWICFTYERDGEILVDVGDLKEIAGWLDGSRFAMEFDKTPLQDAMWLAEEAGVEAVLVGAREAGIHSGLDLFTKIKWDDAKDMAEVLEGVLTQGSQVVLEMGAAKGQWQDSLVMALRTPTLWKRVFVDRVMDMEAVRALDERMPGIGFCVRGSEEEQLGVKSFDDLDDLMEGMRDWD
jgi:phosphoribosylanthranilate isomerase